jgi:hypothetical protein
MILTELLAFHEPNQIFSQNCCKVDRSISTEKEALRHFGMGPEKSSRLSEKQEPPTL